MTSRDPTHRDLAYTVQLIVAKAIADDEHARWAAETRATVAATMATRPARFTLTAMAAATSTALPLPLSLETGDGDLAARYEQNGDEIWVTLQLQGLDALEQYAESAWLLASEDGAVAYPFHFDADGRALCVLADTAAVRAALHQLVLHPGAD
jgi:hypothetical protein